MQHDPLHIIFGRVPHLSKNKDPFTKSALCAHQENQPHCIQAETSYLRVARVLGLEAFCDWEGGEKGKKKNYKCEKKAKVSNCAYQSRS